ncbi:MAG: transglycosylase domain-containing protein [Bellilinea sp.]
MQSFQRTQLVRRHHRRRSERQEHKSRPFKQAGLGLAGLLVVVFSLLTAGLGYAAYTLTSGLPDVAQIPAMLDAQNGTLLQPTRLYDRTGTTLLAALENPGMERRFLPLEAAQANALSPELAQAAVMFFQPDYWEAPYLDMGSLTADRPATIAERLVSNILLPTQEGGLVDRLQVRLLASQTLTRYGKAQVLEWYLNSASFGHLTFGADSAARLYLGKSASQLNWFEAALLIAAIETPALNPLDAPTAAHERQLEVLDRMAETGLISLTDLEAARTQPIITPEPQQQEETTAAAFTALVLDQVADVVGHKVLERGRLQIITTLDYDLQVQLDCTIRAQLSRLAEVGGGGPASACPAADLLPQLPLTTGTRAVLPELAASGAVLDPLSGQVLALTGDTTLTGGESMLIAHPSGTLQSPWLALTGFARGLSPATLVWDIPATAEEGTRYPQGFHGPARLRTALANDYLAGLNQILQQVGLDAVTATVRSLGLSDFALPQDSAEVLTSGAALSPLEAAYGYVPFSTLGVQSGVQWPEEDKLAPQLVLAVENTGDNSKSVEISPTLRPVINEQLAYLVHHVLSDEPARWPSLKHPNPLELDRPAGAKTSSADLGGSTWTAGYTRQTVSAVWLGYADEETQTVPLGVNYAAGIWHAIMQYRSNGQPALGWERPAGLIDREVCNPSGLLPTPDCPNVVSELFLAGSIPTRTDDLYQRFEINRETGRLATAFTPLELVEERVFLVAPPEAQEWSRLVQLPVPPQEYDTIQLPQPNPVVQINSPAQFSMVRGKVQITGTAAGRGFASYSLQLGQGINPAAWQTVGAASSTPVENALLGEIDTTGLDGLYIIRLQVVQENQRVQSSLLQITVDNAPPRVTMPYPLEGQVFPGKVPRTITLQAEAEDAVGLERIEFWADGRMVGERRGEPFALVWDAPIGSHTLKLRAIDLAGNETWSDEVTIEVQ